MDKESIIGLQKIDCNCNDCKHLLRNIYQQQIQNQLHEKWQRDEYNRKLNDELFTAYTFRDTTELSKLFKRRFMPKKPNMGYGNCKKLDLKEVSFIPNGCQLETQQCFEHRKS